MHAEFHQISFGQKIFLQIHHLAKNTSASISIGQKYFYQELYGEMSMSNASFGQKIFGASTTQPKIIWPKIFYQEDQKNFGQKF